MDFIEEMSAYFNARSTTKAQLREEAKLLGHEKTTFIDRYVPSEASVEKEMERRYKISQTMKNRKRHPNSLKNIEYKAHWAGRKMSEETRAKMSESHKLRYQRLKGIK